MSSNKKSQSGHGGLIGSSANVLITVKEFDIGGEIVKHIDKLHLLTYQYAKAIRNPRSNEVR